MTDADAGDRAFDHTEIEPKWQRAWEDADVFRISEDASDPAYVLAMFPYTSGELHMGHVRNYTITDSFARFERLRGEEVLHPMGWDSFGLPAENAAEERDTNPRDWTMSCIDSMAEQMRSMGFGYDWDREVTTCEPEYYRWNQWLFKQFMDEGLVERQETELNWCPSCETVLADEQVEGDDEQCWRCDTPIDHRELPQWFFTITDYADELLAALDELDGWPRNVREMQRNWIGKQEGASVAFELTTGDEVEIFTTRLDTIYGATFFAVSPGHPVAASLAETNDEVADYVHRAQQTSEELAETSGVFTGEYAHNPATGEKIPVYVADYVLEDVGTGALYAVPAHDDRDHAFATAHEIPIRRVIDPAPDADADAAEIDVEERAYTDDGVLVNSGEYDGLTSATARERFVETFDGSHEATYQLRDWAISRQRYWGTPIPLIDCEECGYVQVPDEDLPVELPSFIHTTGNPLDAAEEWKQVTCPDCGGDAERETDTMNTFVDSSWYFMRYVSPELTDAPFDHDRASDWLPVDQYVGGIEHAVMHLLYARFFTKVLDDMDLVDGVREPFTNLTNQGMVLGADGNKMSKSLGNGVSPQEIVETYGADTARLFMMEAAQPETEFAWDPEGVASANQFLQGIYELVEEYATGRVAVADGGSDPAAAYVDREIAATIGAVESHYESFTFNHAVRAIRELVSLLRQYRDHTTPRAETFERGIEAVVTALSPVAPHVAEEAWHQLGNDSMVAEADWPDVEPPAAYDIERRVVETTQEDVREIISTVEIENPERITIAVAPEWTYDAYDVAREAGDDVVGAVMRHDEFRQRGEAAAEFAKQLAAHAEALNEQLSPDREYETLRRARWLFEREFDADIVVEAPGEADDDLLDNAQPGRPGIHVEEA